MERTASSAMQAWGRLGCPSRWKRLCRYRRLLLVSTWRRVAACLTHCAPGGGTFVHSPSAARIALSSFGGGALVCADVVEPRDPPLAV